MGEDHQRAQHRGGLMAAAHPKPAASGWDCHVHVLAAGLPAVGGHYLPQDHPLERIETLATAHGFGHLVLVQPSVYGSDNSLMLSALQKSQGRHRGVVVVQEAVSDAELQRWHALGVRGIRCNLVSPVGNHRTDWTYWAPRLRELGWHVQWYAHAYQLDQVLSWHTQHRLPCVLDHDAGMHVNALQNQDAWRNLQTLADTGAWIKLSGWYRLGLAQPYDLQLIKIREVCGAFEGRCVWGSDWPHTSFAAEQAPAYEQLWQPLRALLGSDAMHKLAAQAQQLYLA
jgi:predicted TIM-barrel fold metal-dependent hydrolase